jgi:hypothetical protein
MSKEEDSMNDKLVNNDNVIDFMSKSKMRRIAAETGHNPEDISDEDFQVFLQALFGPYKGGAYLPE